MQALKDHEQDWVHKMGLRRKSNLDPGLQIITKNVTQVVNFAAKSNKDLLNQHKFEMKKETWQSKRTNQLTKL